LAFHSLDVAAVGEALLTTHDKLGRHLAKLLGMSQEEAVSFAVYLLSLHDVGKFAKKFQAKVPLLFPPCFSDDAAAERSSYDHGAGGLRLFDSKTCLFHICDPAQTKKWRVFISAVTGHHGAPPSVLDRGSEHALRRDFGTVGFEAVQSFIGQLQNFRAPPAGLLPNNCAQLSRASFAIAGLAVLSDWIGSNQHWFPYQSPDDFPSLQSYWAHATKQAKTAVKKAGILPAKASDHLTYAPLIGKENTPSPMQVWAERVSLPTGPNLFIIEDETGSGKTEAALMLAHRLMTAGKAEGLYIALPTMATANAMFDRLGRAQRKLFAVDSSPSIALAHGASNLHDGFRAAILNGGRAEKCYGFSSDDDEMTDDTASAACAAWIADDRRRAFFADIGAGTIDQALLSILPSRHQSLRLFGLMRRVLILDEIHAYDAYMQREIESLLEFQAGLGGSAILLSATLPLAVRKRLVNAFDRGLGKTPESLPDDSSYPLATTVAPDGKSVTPVASQPNRARKLPVRFLRRVDEALDAVEQAARAGHAALYIRNTVDDAIDAHSQLVARGLKPILFHARFALVDRLALEKRIVSTFGKNSTLAERTGQILIATQVVEQSLDLDFDVLVTDLAPIDLLIQRAGRLWRHARRDRTSGAPELLVLSPSPVADAKTNWFKAVFDRAAYVYKDHARLWQTARVLEDWGAIESPAGLRALIEAVYGPNAADAIPPGLEGSFYRAEGQSGADRGVSSTNVLTLGKGFARDGGAWDSDIRTPTRLIEVEQATLRLAIFRDGRLRPYAQLPGEEVWRAWRLSEVNIARSRIGAEVLSPAYQKAAAEAKADWTKFDKEKILVVLEKNGGESFTAEIGPGAALNYNPVTGLS